MSEDFSLTGAGTGFYINFWGKLGVKQITGIDITNKSIEELIKKYPNHRFIKGNISNLDCNKILPNEKFDIITAFNVLFHIVDEEDFKHSIENSKGFSRKKTIILIMDNFLKEHEVVGWHERARTLSYYEKVLSSYSIEIKEIKPIFYFMNTPIDIEAINNNLLRCLIKTMWWLNLKSRVCCRRIGKLGGIIAYLWTYFLYLFDRIILRYTNIGPSTKLLIAKFKSK